MTVTNGNGKHTAAHALEVHGFDGGRLLKLAHRVANDYIREHVPYIGDKREDLVSAMYERACRAALRFDGERTDGQHFQSFLAKHMEHAAGDFFRRKSEGFGDRRYGNDGRIILSDMQDEVDTHMDFEFEIRAHRMRRWQRAAYRAGESFGDWAAFMLDRAADDSEQLYGVGG